MAKLAVAFLVLCVSAPICLFQSFFGGFQTNSPSHSNVEFSLFFFVLKCLIDFRNILLVYIFDFITFDSIFCLDRKCVQPAMWYNRCCGGTIET